MIAEVILFSLLLMSVSEKKEQKIELQHNFVTKCIRQSVIAKH